MFINILLNDLKFIISKKKILFLFFIVGMFFISMLSNLILNTLRYDYHLNLIPYDRRNIIIIFDEPVDGKTIYETVSETNTDIADVFLLSELAAENDKDNLEYHLTKEYPPFIPLFDEIGIIGYSKSKYNLRTEILTEGRYLNNTDKTKKTAVIYDGLSARKDKNNKIHTEGITFDIIGLVKYESFHISNNLYTDIQNINNFDIKIKAIRFYYYIPPSAAELSEFKDNINALGNNRNNIDKIETFNINVIINFIISSIIFIGTLFLLLASLILLFKCWIQSTQRIYTIYSLCGMNDRQTAFLRYIQMFILIFPIYLFSFGIFYIITTIVKYKKYAFPPSIPFSVINFIVIFILSIILITFQNRKNNKYHAIENI